MKFTETFVSHGGCEFDLQLFGPMAERARWLEALEGIQGL